jgi:hypothetical protein
VGDKVNSDILETIVETVAEKNPIPGLKTLKTPVKELLTMCAKKGNTKY